MAHAKINQPREAERALARAGDVLNGPSRRPSPQVGDTEVLAGMISDSIACAVYRIEAADTYPDDYDDTVARNVREQDADARPAIANPLPAIDGYNAVLLASGNWNVRPPMIMRTFAEPRRHREDRPAGHHLRHRETFCVSVRRTSS